MTDIPIMSSDDFSIHADECEDVAGGMLLSNLSDEIASLDDPDCECWSEYGSVAEIE